MEGRLAPLGREQGAGGRDGQEVGETDPVVERARIQWAGILGGELAESDAELVVRWPGSPMRLVVEIDPVGEDGPLSIELASDRPLDLPAGPHPHLGAAFVRP